MNAKVLIAGVAIAVMATGAASAKTMKHKMSSGGSYAAPSQPIPYSQMDAYMKASPKQRTAMMSGAPADTSSTGMSSGAMSSSAPPASGGSMTPDTAPAPAAAPMTPPVNSGAPPMNGMSATPPATPPTPPTPQ